MKLQEVLNDENERYYFFRENNTKYIYFRKPNFIYRFPEKDYLRSIEFRYPVEGIETLEICEDDDIIFSAEECLSEDWIKVYENPVMLR